MPCTVGCGIQARFIKHAPLYCCSLEFATVSKAMLSIGSFSMTVLPSEHENRLSRVKKFSVIHFCKIHKF